MCPWSWPAAPPPGWATSLAPPVTAPGLGRLSLYLTPLSTLQSVCGAQALACYDSLRERIYASPEDQLDSPPAKELVTHEYGHHLANNRSGELTGYTLAFQFSQLPHAVIAVSITSALLPELSLAASRADADLFHSLFYRGLRVIGALLVPAAILIAVLAQPLLPLLAVGRLTDTALHTTATTLSAFALGLPGFSIFILCTRALQARKDTRRVFYLYVLENGINVVLALGLYPSLHVRGLALSYAVAYTVTAVVAYVVVMRTAGTTRGLPFAASTGPTR